MSTDQTPDVTTRTAEACSDCGDLLARGLELLNLWNAMARRDMDDADSDHSVWFSKFGEREEDAESASALLLEDLSEHRDHGLPPGAWPRAGRDLSASPTADRLAYELGALAFVIASELTTSDSLIDARFLLNAGWTPGLTFTWGVPDV